MVKRKTEAYARRISENIAIKSHFEGKCDYDGCKDIKFLNKTQDLKHRFLVHTTLLMCNNCWTAIPGIAMEAHKG